MSILACQHVHQHRLVILIRRADDPVNVGKLVARAVHPVVIRVALRHELRARAQRLRVNPGEHGRVIHVTADDGGIRAGADCRMCLEQRYPVARAFGLRDQGGNAIVVVLIVELLQIMLRRGDHLPSRRSRTC